MGCNRIRRGDLSTAQLQGWCGQIYQQTVAVIRALGLIYANAPEPDVRKAIFENLSEEHLGVFSGCNKPHYELMVDLGTYLGMTQEQMDKVPTTPATRAIINYIDAVLRRP